MNLMIDFLFILYAGRETHPFLDALKIAADTATRPGLEALKIAADGILFSLLITITIQ